MRIARWGNSLAVRLPTALVESMGLQEGDDVQLSPGPGCSLEVERDRRRQEALAVMERLARPLPEGYRFDREEANERWREE